MMDFTGRLSKALFFNPNNETNVNFLIRQTTWQHKFCPACLLFKIEQVCWAELVLPGVLSDQKFELGFVISAEELSF